MLSTGGAGSRLPHRLAETYPHLFHVAHAAAWPSIERHGLLCTTSLLDLFEVDPSERVVIERQRRPESIVISHPEYGSATIRDQKPLLEARLETALIDMTPVEWYELLNAHVFLWPTRDRMLTMLGAAAYRTLPQLIVTLDTAGLVASYHSSMLLSRLNSGTTKPFAWERGKHTFQTLEEYPLDERIRRYGTKSAVAEVLIGSAIAPLKDVTVSAVIWKGGQPVETVWQ